MLRNTFCHIPGIGPQSELKLWRAGFTCWEALLEPATSPRYPGRKSCREQLRESLLRYEQRDPAYFAERLPAGQRWRLFADFRDSCAFLDIETTGLGSFSDHITAIALYDGAAVRHFVHGENLKDFPDALARYRVLVTYNGSSFDLPFLERQFRIEIRQAHIDLRYVLKSLGVAGGLKNCERRLGVGRAGLEDIDGAVAVLLWREFRRRRDRRALETLLAYNAQDALNLEPLMVEAYNRKLEETPFAQSHRLPAPPPVVNPFAADAELVRRLLRELPWVVPFARWQQGGPVEDVHALYARHADVLCSAVLADVLDALGHRCGGLPPALRPLRAEWKLFGRARTLSAVTVASAAANPYAVEMECVDALRPGDVLVATTNGDRGSALWGELLSTAARARGAVGAVIDGLTRDAARIVAMDFPVFAAGFSPLDSRGRLECVSHGEPIRVGDCVVRPGDWVFGDVDGLVAVPADLAARAFARAVEKATGENRVRAELAAGRSLREVFAEHGIL